MIQCRRIIVRAQSHWPSKRMLSTQPENAEEILELSVSSVAGSSNARKRETHTTWKFVDKVQIEVKGGRGGNGCVSYEVLSPGKKRPSGGSGGKGGNVFVVADRGLTGMKFQTFHFNARDGTHGGSAGLTGRRGDNIHVRVPLGTIVSEKCPVYYSPSFPPRQTRPTPRATAHVSHAPADEEEEEEEEGDEDWEGDGDTTASDETDIGGPEDRDYDEDEQGGAGGPQVEIRVLRELNMHGDSMLVAEGGVPGIGNAMMSGSASHRNRSVPLTKLPGQTGEARSLLLELKIIADVGLVGYPNAGKSTLLRALSNARPKVAPYPFTTLHPSVGVVQYSDSERITVADIPGLIEGAHEDKGLGHDFLKHIERTKVLLYVVDGAGCEGREPVGDLASLQRELELYDAALHAKPALVFINKADLRTGKVALRRVVAEAERGGMEVLFGSAKVGEGMGPLAAKLRLLLEEKNSK